MRELEDLIIDAIYLDLLQGKLDQRRNSWEVSYIMGRDLEPGKAGASSSIPQRLVSLSLNSAGDYAYGFRASTTSGVLTTLDAKINSIAADTAAAKMNLQEHERLLQANLKEVHEKQKEKSLGGWHGLAARGVSGCRPREYEYGRRRAGYEGKEPKVCDPRYAFRHVLLILLACQRSRTLNEDEKAE